MIIEFHFAWTISLKPLWSLKDPVSIHVLCISSIKAETTSRSAPSKQLKDSFYFIREKTAASTELMTKCCECSCHPSHHVFPQINSVWFMESESCRKTRLIREDLAARRKRIRRGESIIFLPLMQTRLISLNPTLFLRQLNGSSFSKRTH